MAIDEKKLIEKIKHRQKTFYGYEEGFSELDNVIAMIEHLPKVGEWIPCSERLPEVEGTMYWTTHEDGSVVQHGWSERHGFIYNWELGEKRARMGTVIAWMPMFKPIPYKE